MYNFYLITTIHTLDSYLPRPFLNKKFSLEPTQHISQPNYRSRHFDHEWYMLIHIPLNSFNVNQYPFCRCGATHFWQLAQAL